MNSLMVALWSRIGPVGPQSSLSDLQDLLQRGWIVGPADALLLRGLYGAGWKADWLPDEVSQHEYEVNDVAIPSDGLPRGRDLFLSGLVGRARDFAFHALRNAKELDCSNLLTAVISVGIDEDYLLHGATVKFFTRRGTPLQYFDDLERYRLEAIALVDFGDVP